MSVRLFASGLREHCRRCPSADGPGLGGVDTAIEGFFQFPKSCIVAPIRTQGPLEHVVFDRLSAKGSHGLGVGGGVPTTTLSAHFVGSLCRSPSASRLSSREKTSLIQPIP